MVELSARKHFGAKGDGTTDDTAALQAALTEWASTKVATPDVYRTAGLTIEPGVYKVTDELGAVVSGNIAGGAIRGYGAVIYSDAEGPDYGIHFDNLTGVATQVRNFDVHGLSLDGCGFKMSGNGSGSPTQSSFKVGLHAMTVGHAPAHAFDLTAFEIQLHGLRAGVTSTTHAAFNVACSSLDLFGCTSNGGMYGLYSAGNVNVNVFGGTFLETQRNAILLPASLGSSISGVHCETNWMDDAAATVRPAIDVVGRVTITAPHISASAAGNITHGMMIYSVGTSQVIGGILLGANEADVDYFVRAGGGAGSEIVLIGNDSYEKIGSSVTVAAFGGNPSPSILTAVGDLTMSNVTEATTLDPTTATTAQVANFVATLARKKLGVL